MGYSIEVEWAGNKWILTGITPEGERFSCGDGHNRGMLIESAKQTIRRRIDRKALGDSIARHPERYKICHSCDSIVMEGAVICPSCSGYRFDSEPERVKAHALEIAKKERESVQAEDLTG